MTYQITGSVYKLHPTTIRNLTDKEVMHIANQTDDPFIRRLLEVADFAAISLADGIPKLRRFNYGIGSDGYMELTYADDGALVEFQDVLDCLKQRA